MLPDWIRFIPDATLDFHEYDSLNPYDIEKILNDFIEDSYIYGHKNLLVITGKGRVVRPFVNKFLKMNKYVEEYKAAGYFNGQDGAYEVILARVPRKVK